MSVSVTAFGQFKGQPVQQFTLVSETGVEVDIINFGVVVRDWRVPVEGQLRSVVLGFDSMDDYVGHSPHFGSLAGRVANRIKGASFELGGEKFKLPPNVGALQLHGGTEGLGLQVWNGVINQERNSVSFSHFSPDGAMGYPGDVTFTAVYTLVGNRLRLDLSAKADRETPISLVQHQYFNLGKGPDVLDHKVQVNSTAYTELGADLCPTGAILPSKGTQYDLRAPRTMRDDAGAPLDYDINLVLDNGRDLQMPVARVEGPDGALTLSIWTDRPGVQFYNGVWTDVAVPGLGGQTYGKHAGLCLEDQNFPDALHNPHFPSIIHGPDRPYRHWCEIEIA
ncbi:galactose mutarotase [Devosia rhodophyticola]|uniref:Aldose 1-epimerase n=1 Tax=Devosia rhodophyticola TaxID=3026423 RepID=A0ABY7Z1Q4_9HYPH|nr:aldose epimerase family protein [Devosia rhodophyticola]WDR07332.1 galactose mutarotase [Devosia rhodophyticola]